MLKELEKTLKKKGLYEIYLENRNYWRKRAEILEDSLNNKAESYILSTKELYQSVIDEIVKEINEWYGKYNPQTLSDTNKTLAPNELDSFKVIITIYLGAKVSSNWKKYLESLRERKRITRMEEIQTRIRHHVETLTFNKSHDIENLLKDIYEESFHRTIYDNSKDYIKLDADSFNLIAKKPWASDGSNFSERIWGKHRSELVSRLNEDLKRNIISGEKPEALIDKIAKDFDVDRKNAARLVYTEKAYVQSMGQKEAFNKLKIKQYELVATLDRRTSDICRFMDGKVYQMSEFEIGITAPPFHPYCRTVVAPFYEDMVTERIARNPEGNSVYIPNMSYKEWFELYGKE